MWLESYSAWKGLEMPLALGAQGHHSPRMHLLTDSQPHGPHACPAPATMQAVSIYRVDMLSDLVQSEEGEDEEWRKALVHMGMQVGGWELGITQYALPCSSRRYFLTVLFLFFSRFQC